MNGLLAAAVDVPGFLLEGGPWRPLVVAGVVAIGGFIAQRVDGSLFDRSIDAAVERPLASLGYGLATHAVIAFAAIYLTARLGRLEVGGVFVGWFGVALGVGLLAVTACIGFGVVGTVVVDTLGAPDGSLGVLVGAVAAGTVTLLDPLLGIGTWLLLVAAGIGGLARRWTTASMGHH